ncbi:uncharacterized protein PV09_09088 [Verruconis gallopava]|uniref:DUF4385 domain-containing protein n=1 Tax=Verruconis gallopava TaxID=253628 RepID=A0A0D1ZYQ9_9PEZI|nr:uncharacterized protein PV09_09088 [Verruconis gallopava]KIV99224.1 hypothetical protein PV09_09088 [Verruconis gallopava]
MAEQILNSRNKALQMSYRIGKGEQRVLSFEPYKSSLLPLWQFRTPEIARKSSQALWERFEAYYEANDFVGMDMTRKFIQMGMSRAKRYANHAGGRKYDKATGRELEKSRTHKDHKDKLEASNIFKAYWIKCKEHEGYLRKKEAFLKEQKAWDREHADGRAKKDKCFSQLINED